MSGCTPKCMVPTGSIDLDGSKHVVSIKDLINEEVKSIHTLALTEPGMGRVSQSLAIEYPKRDFDKTLLARVLDKKGILYLAPPAPNRSSSSSHVHETLP